MNKEQKEILKKIKVLFKQLEATIQEERDDSLDAKKHKDEDWEGGTPMGELPS
tara:strand:- start:586 stop:744 length:159 start_codon:yes stop_codon:yes gene_type:complete